MDQDAKVRATLRVVPDQVDSIVPRPSQQKLQEAARRLNDLGFEVLNRSGFGIEVLATPAQYLEHLNVSVPSGHEAFVASVEHPGGTLQDLVDSVEVVPPAKLF